MSEVTEPVIKQQAPKIEVTPTMVEVVPNKDFKCNIGDTWYSFRKDTRIKVPFEVKGILSNAGNLRI